MNKEKISVIIPSFNRFNYLLNAIESVHSQTYKNIEIIVVNDGSSQEEYYENDLPEKTKIIHIDRDKTPNWGGSRPAVRNFGIEVAEGDFIAFLDDDDLWLPSKLELQIEKIKEHNFGLSATDGYFGYGEYISSNKYPIYNAEHHFKKIKKKYRRTKYLKNNKFPEIWDYQFLKVHNCVILSSVLVEADLIKQLGGFRGLYRSDHFVHTADHDCWLGLVQLTKLVYIDEPLFYYDAGHGDGKNYTN